MLPQLVFVNMEYINYVFIIVLIFETANSNFLDFKSEMYQNITDKLEEILSMTAFDHSNNNPEREILNKFKEIDNIIELFEDKIENIDEILEKVTDEYEFVLNPWRKIERAKLHVELDYQCFRNFIQNNVYVDEVITDEFCQKQKSKENLEIIHLATVPPSSDDRKNSILYKLYISLWYQVSEPYF